MKKLDYGYIIGYMVYVHEKIDNYQQWSLPSQHTPKISNKILTTPRNFTPALELLERI